MSVDKLRGSYHVNKVSPSEIGLLMSAQSYRPEVTDAISTIKNEQWKPLQELITNVISPGPHPKYDGNYPCLKTKNVQDLIADTTAADFADISGFKDLSKVQVRHGDLLINLTGAGSIGRVSVYYGEDLPITNQHIARMSPNLSLIDEGYLVAYLRSYHAERALEQGVAGSTGQINMVNDHVRAIPVRMLNAFAQTYIGSKVRQAERLRAWAKSLKDELFALEHDIPVKKLKCSTEHHVRTSVVELTDNRLDAEFYEAKHLHLSRQFDDNFNYLGSLVSNFKYGASVKADYVAHGRGIPFIRGNAIEGNEISSKDIVYLDPTLLDELKDNYVYEGDVMVTRSGTVGSACEVYESFDKYAYGSFIIKCVPIPELIDPTYLSWFLNSWVGQQQFRRWENGAVQLNINTEELSAIQIWLAPKDFQDKVSTKVKALRLVNELSQTLVKSSTLLVESLIEGHISEQELIDAQQALELGNFELDRALLARISAKGMDVEGASPLFDDLDQLYSLLEQAELAQQEA